MVGVVVRARHRKPGVRRGVLLWLATVRSWGVGLIHCRLMYGRVRGICCSFKEQVLPMLLSRGKADGKLSPAVVHHSLPPSSWAMHGMHSSTLALCCAPLHGVSVRLAHARDLAVVVPASDRKG